MPKTPESFSSNKRSNKRKNKKENMKAPIQQSNNWEQMKPVIETASSSQAASTPESSILNIDENTLLQGILWSEILGKPVSKRRGRW